MILALTFALAAQDAPLLEEDRAPPLTAWNVDAPLAFAASSPASGFETNVATWLLLRGGRTWDAATLTGVEGSDVGLDLALWLGGYESEGTPEVNVTRVYTAVEGRGRMGYRAFHTTHSALTPYAFAGVRAGGGVLYVSAYDDSRSGLLGIWGARAGLGLDLTIFRVSPRVELAAGMKNLRLELSSAVSVAARF